MATTLYELSVLDNYSKSCESLLLRTVASFGECLHFYDVQITQNRISSNHHFRQLFLRPFASSGATCVVAMTLLVDNAGAGYVWTAFGLTNLESAITVAIDMRNRWSINRTGKDTYYLNLPACGTRKGKVILVYQCRTGILSVCNGSVQESIITPFKPLTKLPFWLSPPLSGLPLSIDEVNYNAAGELTDFLIRMRALVLVERANVINDTLFPCSTWLSTMAPFWVLRLVCRMVRCPHWTVASD